jgi:circadian clock protein KaiC
MNSSLDLETSIPDVSSRSLLKCPTGIAGLDEIMQGGLPRGRPTLLCGGAGCGKTLVGMEFLVRGATEFEEPGVCLCFEETAEELCSNVASMGFDLPALVAQKKLAIDHVFIERNPVEETGEYDLDALFIRIAYAAESIGARRVVLDGIEALFAGLENEAILRSELRRLFRWLKEKGLTGIITGERGNGTLTRHGIEEYVSDCVILLDHRVSDTVLTRRLRVVKYRGSTHGTNEYPFLIEEDGVSVLPVTSAGMRHDGSNNRVSTGVPALDDMFRGCGYFQGSSILVSGTAGTGKTSLAAHLVNSACARGERCVFFSFEESGNQIVRNMRSIGIDLGRWVDEGLLQFHCARPSTLNLEMHLVKIHKIIKKFQPSIVAVDPVTALLHSGSNTEAKSMSLRLVDFLRECGITTLMTSLTGAATAEANTDVAISSLVDTWLQLRDIESGGERNRGLYIRKSRGDAHSNQIREFLLTDRGVELREVYLGEKGMLTGSARIMQETLDASLALSAEQQMEKSRLLLDRRRKALEAQMAALQLEIETEEQESRQLVAQREMKLLKGEQDRKVMARSRSGSDGHASTEASEFMGVGND